MPARPDIARRAAAVLLVLAALQGASCRGGASRGGFASASAALIMTGDLLEDASSVRVWVFDLAVQGCSADGDGVDDPRAPSLYATDAIFPDEEGAFSCTFIVPEGRRTFYAEVYGDDPGRAIATGCAVQEVSAGQANSVRIRINPEQEPDAEETADVPQEDPPLEPEVEADGDGLEEELPQDVTDADGEEPDGSCTALACPSTDWRSYLSAGATGFSHGSISKTIAVDDCCLVVEDLKVSVNVTYASIGDLTLRLERPDGMAIPLHKKEGGTDDNIFGEYPTDLTPTVDLCFLAGGPSLGTWSLILRNDGAFGGTFVEWGLQVSGARERCRDDAFYPAGPFPAVIPDNDAAGIDSGLSVPADFTVSGVEVYVSISHENIGDLIVTLSSPSGRACDLHVRTGSGSDNIITTYPVPTTPAEDLSIFTGDGSAGTWTLSVVDFTSVPSSTPGELNAWILYLH
jgi:subtilisin-like proprotein convertase family protein